jgi:cardiolipin synthase
MIRPGIRNVPNLLSALRLLAAPLAAWLILSGHDSAALLTFAAAGASDGLDGFIARRWHVTSGFGAWLDPAADKLLMVLCLAALVMVGATPKWLLVLVVARDLGMVAAWLLIHLRGPDVSTAPLLIGKISTAVQILYILGMLLLLALDVEAPHLAWAAAWACGLFTALSGCAYGGVFLRGLGHRIA